MEEGRREGGGRKEGRMSEGRKEGYKKGVKEVGLGNISNISVILTTM